MVLCLSGNFQYKYQAIFISAEVKMENDMLINKLLFFFFSPCPVLNVRKTTA